MVDVSDKPDTARLAIAGGFIKMQANTLPFLNPSENEKGDVLKTAELAGIMAAKRTSDLVPLCHPLQITGVKLSAEVDTNLPGVRLQAMVKTSGKTGVEMEALTAVSIFCLTVYDMLKAVDKFMEIGGIELLEKTGGKSGNYGKSGG